MSNRAETTRVFFGLGLLGVSFFSPEAAFAQRPTPTTLPTPAVVPVKLIEPYEVDHGQDIDSWVIPELNVGVVVSTFCRNDIYNPSPDGEEFVRILLRRLEFENGASISLQVLLEWDIQIEAPAQLQKRHVRGESRILTLGSDPQKENGFITYSDFNHGPAFTLILLTPRGPQIITAEKYFGCPQTRFSGSMEENI